MDLKQHIGLRVRAERQRLSLAQEQLAERVGKAVETISNIERGFAYTGLEISEKLSAVLDESIVSFFKGVDEAGSLSRERVELENELSQVARKLDDRDLRTTLQMARTFQANKAEEQVGLGFPTLLPIPVSTPMYQPN